jgi:hypothetical protein
VKPFRASIELTVAAPDLTAASIKWDDLQSAADALGFHLEGGAVGEMDPEDVIAGSPLDEQLSTAKEPACSSKS